jgi:hypothetical protein
MHAGKTSDKYNALASGDRITFPRTFAGKSSKRLSLIDDANICGRRRATS